MRSRRKSLQTTIDDTSMPGVCAPRLKVLADASRLSVLQQLARKPCAVRELEAELSLEQSLISHHLRVLREAGLVESRRDGKQIVYSVASFVQVSAPEEGEAAIHLGCCKLVF